MRYKKSLNAGKICQVFDKHLTDYPTTFKSDHAQIRERGEHN